MKKTLNQVEDEIAQYVNIAQRGLGPTSLEFEALVASLKADALRVEAGEQPVYKKDF